MCSEAAQLFQLLLQLLLPSPRWLLLLNLQSHLLRPLPAVPLHLLPASPLKPHLLLLRPTLATSPLHLLLGSALARRLLRGPPFSPVPISTKLTEWPAPRHMVAESASGLVAAAIVGVSQ